MDLSTEPFVLPGPPDPPEGTEAFGKGLTPSGPPKVDTHPYAVASGVTTLVPVTSALVPQVPKQDQVAGMPPANCCAIAPFAVSAKADKANEDTKVFRAVDILQPFRDEWETNDRLPITDSESDYIFDMISTLLCCCSKISISSVWMSGFDLHQKT